MSVQTKMTAIADKIRALLGITGAMGLDEMATNLAAEQSNLANAFSAVSSKGGTVSSALISTNLASAIESIPEGVTVQRASGTVSLTGSNKTVNCGFQPDALMLTLNETYTDSGMTYLLCAGVLFNETSTGGNFETTFFGTNFNYLYTIWGKRTSTGFTAAYIRQTVSNSATSNSSKSFNYVAIKYT